MRLLPLLKRLAPFAVPIPIFLVVGGLYSKMKAHRNLTDSDYAREHGMPLPVRIYRVDDGPLNETTPAECTLQANPLVNIDSKIRGRIASATHVGAGDVVEAGAKLVTLEDQPERLAVARAEALVQSHGELVTASRELFQYYDGVRSQGLGLERDLREAAVSMARAKKDLEDAKSQLQENRAQLAATRANAPIGGVVLEIVQPGEASLESGHLAVIARLDPILLLCQLPEEKLTVVQAGMQIQASFPSRPGETHEGKIQRVTTSPEEVDRLITIRAELPNPQSTLLPGLHGIGEIRNTKHSLRIPAVALINPRRDLAQVFVVDFEGKARLKKISAGASGGGYVEILSGLQSGERVVVAGQLGLREGDVVRIGNPEEQP